METMPQSALTAVVRGPQNETTALLTFYNDTFTERVFNNGPMRIINRVGTTTIYLDTSPDGDFASPDSFRDGVPVQTSEHRHQVILDTVTGRLRRHFQHDHLKRLLSTRLAELAPRKSRAKIQDDGYRTSKYANPPVAHIAGFAVGDLKR